MTIGSFVIIMVSGVFLVQSDFYDFLLRRSQVQDNARTVVQAVQSVVPSIPAGGVVVAAADRLVVRRPQTLAGVCDIVGSDLRVHLAEGIGSLVEADAEGLANWIPGTGWDYHSTSVASLTGSSGATEAAGCAAEGADTSGATDDFMELNNVDALTGVTNELGDVLMIYEEFEMSFAASTLIPSQTALYVGISGGTLVEYSNGLDSDAAFEYRVGSTWSSSVSGGSLANIEAVRINANTRIRGSAAAASDATFDLVLEIPVGIAP